ncbi:MAG: twin-arginine translocase TatA/TatE family subunit [Thermoplasmata archaeon]
MKVIRMIGNIMDWLILIVVILVLFGGAKKIPEFAKSLGRAMGEFKRGQMEVEEEIKKSIESKNKDNESETKK